MTNFLDMMLAFAVIISIALLFCNVIRVKVGEGMLLSSSLVILFLYLSSLTGTFTFGMYAIWAAALLGVGMLCIRAIQRRSEVVEQLTSPVLLILLGYFVFWMIIYHNDFIQHVDEFHEWAAAVKYMLEKDKMPVGSDFLGGGGQYAFATSLFHLFFQKMTGYSEQNIYVSSILLSWIGFMLPFSLHKKEDWKNVLIYSVIVYIALYTLYYYATKSSYVDVPTAAWAGGLAGWWINREKGKKSNCLVAVSGLVLLHFFKPSAGLLMSVLVLLFMLIYTFGIEKRFMYQNNRMRKLPLYMAGACVLVCIGSALLYGAVLSIHPYETVVETAGGDVQTEEVSGKWTIAGIACPDTLNDKITAFKVSEEKAEETIKTFITRAVGYPLSPRSELGIAFLPFLLIPVLILIISGDIYGQKEQCRIYIYYVLFAALVYLVALYFAYVYLFAYEYSVKGSSAQRYFAICSIYLFVLSLSVLLQKEHAEKRKVQKYVSIGLLIFFSLGLNSNYIVYTTAINKEKIPGYEKILTVRKSIAQIENVIDENDKVYMICQYSGSSLNGAELITAPAIYYMEETLSNYLITPWMFQEGGSVMKLENCELTIQDLPALLRNGEYTYVWIYATDKYLTKQLPEVMDCAKVLDSSLYRVVYEDGIATGLEYVMTMETE